MRRYVALLRGINISGKNKISMSELKVGFIEISCVDVVTYLNSGNIVFSIDEGDENTLAAKINQMIQEQFHLDIPVFVMPVSTAESIAEKIGEPTKELEQVFICENVIFWSFDRAKYSRANWWKKTAGVGIGELLTIRTANTLRKIAEM